MDVFKTLILDTPDSIDNISGVLAVVNGGTGADNAPDARVNLLPDYTGNANKVLSLNGTATDVEWTSNGAGDVAGPASSTDHAVARFDSTTGKVIQNSGVTISDANLLTASQVNSTGAIIAAGSGSFGDDTDITGDLTVTGDVSATKSLLFGSNGAYAAGSIYSDANWGMILRAKTSSPTTADFAFQNSAGTELGRWSSSGLAVTGAGSFTGNVGIGLTAPVNKLEIVGTNAAAATSGSAANGAMRLYGSGSGAVLDSGIGGDAGWLQARIYNNYASQLPLLLNPNGGNVGIGTTGPTARLEITGPLTADTINQQWNLFSGVSAAIRCGSDAHLDFGTITSHSTHLMAGGTRYLSVTAAGNVGVGTTGPSTFRTKVLEVADATNAGIVINGDAANAIASLRLTNSGTSGWDVNYNFPNVGDLGFFDIGAADTRMTLTSAGRVGIGTTAPSVRLSVVENTEAIGITLQGSSTDSGISISNTGTNGKEWVLYSSSDGSGLGSGNFNVFQRGAGGGSRLAIDDTGNVGIGTTAPSYQLQLSTDSAAKPSTNTWTIVSDSRIKTETGEYTKGLDAVLSLRPVTYRYNGKAGMVDDGEDKISIIAQEAVNAFPECVGSYMTKLDEDDEEETEVLNWNGHALTFALVNSIKELTARLEALENN